MPYVSRDENGKINGIGDRPSGNAKEFLPNDHPEVMQYLRGASPSVMMDRLSATDLEMARIAEDLIDVLITRNILNFTDFPVEAQKKLMARQKLRKSLSALSNLVTDEDDIL
ncbi:hypothetical protein HH303_01970 [Rhodospirillaceae bacterium KN72]|uniref:Tryptophan synthase subunit beta like protein n=1 Tax=Pacificispira spongiicola TaxID=2729598 RepID=A0A7Y0DX64_9PROT|nr:hypothetical protein [Pacificispira spongiicola]NMM43226.1 hypothetical protein [Pacificispira spongiicola]